MSFGSKKSSGSDIRIAAPPRITQTNYTSPAGDQFITQSQGNTQYFKNILAPKTQQVVDQSLQGLHTLAGQLMTPDQSRVDQINQRAKDFYDVQARGINRIYDDQRKQTQADLNKRFGGAYNATFGADELARVDNNRATELVNRQQQSGLLAEDLKQQDENSQTKRFQLFQNFLASLNGEAQDASSAGSQILATDRSRASQLALQQAQLSQRAIEQQNASGDQHNQARQQAVATMLALAAL